MVIGERDICWLGHIPWNDMWTADRAWDPISVECRDHICESVLNRPNSSLPNYEIWGNGGDLFAFWLESQWQGTLVPFYSSLSYTWLYYNNQTRVDDMKRFALNEPSLLVLQWGLMIWGNANYPNPAEEVEAFLSESSMLSQIGVSSIA